VQQQAEKEEGCIPAMRKPGAGANPIAKQPSTTNIRLPRATTRSLIAVCRPNRDSRREYMTGRMTISTTNVATALNGVMKLAYNIR
jgi:hypothetical protein